MASPITTQLLNISTCPLTQATTHPFLQQAGKGQITKPILSQWLSQDRLYAQSYIRFIGQLLSKIRLPPHNPDPSKLRTPTAENRAVDVLIDALVNIRTELKLFEDVAAEYGLDLSALPIATEDGDMTGGAEGGTGGCKAGGNIEDTYFGPNRITHAYIDLFMSAGSPATTVLEGLVVLWATEVCYLRSWKYAASFLGRGDPSGQKDADGGALRNRFIPNWTCNEFEAFVKQIGDVVDEMAGQVKGSQEKEALLGRCVQWWKQVLWLEERFWPIVKVE